MTPSPPPSVPELTWSEGPGVRVLPPLTNQASAVSLVPEKAAPTMTRSVLASRSTLPAIRWLESKPVLSSVVTEPVVPERVRGPR